jgi:hypothetical protein
MRCRGAVIVGLGAVMSTMVAGGLSMPASAASPAVDTSFAAVTTTEYTNQFAGPFFFSWNFSTVTLGPSPAGASLAISYSDHEGGGCQSQFVLDDHLGDTLTGHAGDLGCSNNLVGQITAATGRYEPDLNKTATLTIQVSPFTGEPVLSSCNGGECQWTGVFPIAGSLHVR